MPPLSPGNDKPTVRRGNSRVSPTTTGLSAVSGPGALSERGRQVYDPGAERTSRRSCSASPHPRGDWVPSLTSYCSGRMRRKWRRFRPLCLASLQDPAAGIHPATWPPQLAAPRPGPDRSLAPRACARRHATSLIAPIQRINPRPCRGRRRARRRALDQPTGASRRGCGSVAVGRRLVGSGLAMDH
jgi:hypothetical protein